MSDSQRLMLDKFVQALREQDFLDENYSNQGNAEENRNTLATFCGEAEQKLEKVEKILQQDVVDLESVATMMEEMKGNAARIGGKRVADACGELEGSSRGDDVERSREAYKKVTWEYYILRDCFHHILQAERTIDSSSD